MLDRMTALKDRIAEDINNSKDKRLRKQRRGIASAITSGMLSSPKLTYNIAKDLLSGAAHDFSGGVAGAKGTSTLINLSRIAVAAKLTAPIFSTMQGAMVGYSENIGVNPMLTSSANAEGRRKLEESTYGLTLSLHKIRGKLF